MTANGKADFGMDVTEYGILINIITVYELEAYKPQVKGARGHHQTVRYGEGIVSEYLAISQWRPQLGSVDNEHLASPLKKEVSSVLQKS